MKNAEIRDYTDGKTELSKKISTPEGFINEIKDYLKNNTNKNVLLQIAWHWNIYWGAFFKKFYFEEKHFKELQKLSMENDNLRIIINSCNNWYKFSKKDKNWNKNINIDGNITINSWFSYSENSYSEISNKSLMVADYDWDWKVSLAERDIYLLENYSFSPILSSYYKKETWEIVWIWYRDQDLLLPET